MATPTITAKTSFILTYNLVYCGAWKYRESNPTVEPCKSLPAPCLLPPRGIYYLCYQTLRLLSRGLPSGAKILESWTRIVLLTYLLVQGKPRQAESYPRAKSYLRLVWCRFLSSEK